MALCGRRKKRCSGRGGCKYRFKPEDYELWACPRCGKDRHCEEPVKTDGAACRFHGGASLKGAQAPAFKDGRYSKYLPQDLRERYLEALRDPEALELQSEIAVVELRIGELLAEWQAGDSQRALQTARYHFDRYVKAVEEGKEAQLKKEIVGLRDALWSVGDVDLLWGRIQELIDLRRKLSETQTRREKNDGFSLEDANLLIVFLQTSIIRYVSNPKERAALGAAIESYATQGTSQGDPRI